MDLDGNDGADSGPPLDELLQFVRRSRATITLPSDPLDQVGNWLAAQAWMPKGGGLFGSAYARYMAQNAPRFPTLGIGVSPGSFAGVGTQTSGGTPLSPPTAADPTFTPLKGQSPIPSPNGVSANSAGVGATKGPQLPANFDQDLALRAGGDDSSDISNQANGQPQTQARVNPNAIDGAVFDYGLAGPNDGAEIVDVGNPANRRLRKEWERANGRPWPRDPITGRNHDVAHIKALADGGTNTLDNIRPMPPADHLAEHIAAGDFARWARRAAIAGAFGGRVVRTIPGIDVLSIITGLASGRIRHNNPDNFINDVFGFPSKQDIEDQFERIVSRAVV